MQAVKPASKKYNLDSFDSGHFFEDLSEQESFYFKKFFRGLSIYVFGKVVACLSDRPEDRTFRRKKYKFDIWNGCLIPTNREHHLELLKQIKGTLVHPVITKWLYLPQSSEHFESSMIQLVEMIKRRNILIGIEPELRSKKPKKIKLSSNKK
jgi:hypothetical protein